jgi:hypothetical protein
MLKTPYRSVSILPYPSGLLLCGALFVLGAKLGSTRRKARHTLFSHAGYPPCWRTKHENWIDLPLKLEAREARLLGLDMPTQVAITDPDGGVPLEYVRKILERMDAESDVTPEPAPLPPAIRVGG